MGLYFRKSKSFGPVRLNMSKSGLGLSTGIKGARLSFGSRGTYVNLGRNGIYYRKKIGGNFKKSSKSHVIKNSPSNYKNTYSPHSVTSRNDDYDYSDAIRVYDNPDSNSMLGAEIIKDINRAALTFWIWLIISIIVSFALAPIGVLLGLVAGLLLSRFFSARVNFDLESEADFEWKKFTEILNGLRTSKRLWLIENRQYNVNRKVNAGAASNISRGTARVSVIKPNVNAGFGMRTNVESFIINSSKCRILFLPSGILVKKGAKTVAYSYDQISILSSTVNFIEDGILARDAEVIRQTWQYVNKDGSPDRRFKNNRQLPVCKYGVISIEGVNISIELQTSNKDVSSNVGNAYSHYKGYFGGISSVRDARQLDFSEKTYNEISDDFAKQEPSHNISQEEWSILEEMNNTIHELGNGAYIDVLEEEFGCKVRLLAAQLYQGHAIMLYRTDANEEIERHLKRIEYNLNANTKSKNVIQAVSDSEFIIHLYMDVYAKFGKELPLSKTLKNAIESAEGKLNTPRSTKTQQQSTSNFGNNNYDDILSAGAGLFSGENDISEPSSIDPYDDLFDDEDDDGNGHVDDFMNFFDEE